MLHYHLEKKAMRVACLVFIFWFWDIFIVISMILNLLTWIERVCQFGASF